MPKREDIISAYVEDNGDGSCSATINFVDGTTVSVGGDAWRGEDESGPLAEWHFDVYVRETRQQDLDPEYDPYE